MTAEQSIALSAPRVSLLEQDLTQLSEDELRQFVLQVREKRNSQQLANENKPTRKPRATSESPTKKAQLMASLLADDDSED
jgi:hypothetical protein